MINQVKCKFLCNSVQDMPDSEGGIASQSIKMSAVTDTALGEDGDNSDNQFAKYTPAGDFTITVNNPDVFGYFETGRKYFLDITPVHE